MRPLRRNEKIHDSIQLVVQTSTKAAVAWLTGAKAPYFGDEAIHDLSLGLRSMYTKGRHALEIATADSSDSNLHELRKRSKDLLYACEFLGKASPRARSAATDLRRFTDLLGKHRDLAMLQGVVTAGPRMTERSFRSQLVTLAAREAALLRNRALRIGSGIYDESAATFVRRVRRDWKTWRHNE